MSAETPLLQTDRTDTGRILESKMVAELPLTFNRNFQSLLLTVPGRDPAASRALAVLQLAGLAALRGQRPAGDGQQHADRRARRQPEDRPAAGDHPGRGCARDRQRHDQQLRRGVRPVGRRGDQRDAQVRHQRPQGQRVLLRQQREDQRQRLLHPPEGADQVRQRRLHARRPDRQEQAVLLRRLPADRSTTTATSSARRCRR